MTDQVTLNGSQSNIEKLNLDALCDFIRSDSDSFINHGGWINLFHHVKGQSNFAHSLDCLDHQARPLLQRYAKYGVPVVLESKPWSLQQKDAAI